MAITMRTFDKDIAVASLVKVYGKPGCWGMGFVTSGGHIITAAHCLPGLPTLNDSLFWDDLHVNISDFRQSQRQATALLLSVDPCQDIAVLAVPEDEEICQRLTSVPLFLRETAYDVPIKVRLYTHWGEWLTGTCEFFGPQQCQFPIILDDVITSDLAGTSGSPVFAENGHVLGIIVNSNMSAAQAMTVMPEMPREMMSRLPEKTEACAVWLATMLPYWVLLAEREIQGEAD